MKEILDYSVITELENIIRPIDYAYMLGDKRVLMLGEDHFDAAPKTHIAKQANVFKTIGITHYAIEAPDNAKEILERLNQGEDTDLAKAALGPRGLNGGYENPVRALAGCEIKVVPIDVDEKILKIEQEAREKYLFAAIKQILKNDSARVLVFIGGLHLSRHTFYNLYGIESLVQRLVADKISLSTANFIGGSSDEVNTLFETLGRKGLSDKDFMLDMRPYEMWKSRDLFMHEADFLIHLKEISEY